jgi:hypothetical protein
MLVKQYLLSVPEYVTKLKNVWMLSEVPRRGVAEWRIYCKGELERIKEPKPDDIPAGPGAVYKSQGWNGIRDWLGTE